MTEQGGRSGVLIGPCTAQINRILNVNICFVSNICWVHWVHLEDATRTFFYPVRTSTLVCLCVLKLLSEERLLIFPSHSWTNTPHRPKMKFINPMTWHLAVRKTFPHILNYYQTHSHSHIHIHSSMQGPATRQTTISQTLEILHINMLQSALKWVKVFFFWCSMPMQSGISYFPPQLKLNAIQKLFVDSLQWFYTFEYYLITY